MKFKGKLVELEKITLSEATQIQKDKLLLSLLIGTTSSKLSNLSTYLGYTIAYRNVEGLYCGEWTRSILGECNIYVPPFLRIEIGGWLLELLRELCKVKDQRTIMQRQRMYRVQCQAMHKCPEIDWANVHFCIGLMNTMTSHWNFTESFWESILKYKSYESGIINAKNIKIIAAIYSLKTRVDGVAWNSFGVSVLRLKVPEQLPMAETCL